MESWLVSILVALVGLSGTLVGLYIGYRKWNYEKSREKRAEYVGARQQAYKHLWEKLENIHAVIRRGEFQEKELFDLRQEFNTHVLRTEIYLDEDDRVACNAYLDSVEVVNKGVKESSNASDQEDWAITAAFSTGAMEAYQSMEEGRQQIIGKIKKVLQEEIA